MALLSAKSHQLFGDLHGLMQELIRELQSHFLRTLLSDERHGVHQIIIFSKGESWIADQVIHFNFGLHKSSPIRAKCTGCNLGHDCLVGLRALGSSRDERVIGVDKRES